MAAGTVPRNIALKTVYVVMDGVHDVGLVAVPEKNGLATKLDCACV